MTAASVTPPTTWKVLSQIETTELGPNNVPMKGYRVTFQTGLGNTGSVWIQATQYNNIPYVKSQIATTAALLDTVSLFNESS